MLPQAGVQVTSNICGTVRPQLVCLWPTFDIFPLPNLAVYGLAHSGRVQDFSYPKMTVEQEPDLGEGYARLPRLF
ncbi:hypothetical protein IFM47457_01378 [Aspergillus lentulus]|nr:hypothetical protein IFM47457_01378 [Aspergillus lentulus]